MSNIDFQRQSADLARFNELQDELLSAGPMEAVVAATADLNAPQLRQARDSYLFVEADAAIALSITPADSAAAAADLQSILGLTEVGDQCLLKFVCATADIAADVALDNGGVTLASVIMQLRGAGNAITQVLFDETAAGIGTGTSSAMAFVQVSATNVTAGSEVVTVNILLPGVPSA